MKFAVACAVGASLLLLAAGASARTREVYPGDYENGEPAPSIESSGLGASTDPILRAQVLLDRANFSPGEIDGRPGRNMRTAVLGFQKSRGLKPTAELDERTWAALNRDAAPALIRYTIADADVDGDFDSIPADMMDKAEMEALGYESPVEGLGEKFHSSPQLLKRLNPGKDLEDDGEEILVPNVEPPAAVAGAERVVVDGTDLTVSLLDSRGKTIAQYPATVGSQHDPLPIGAWKVDAVANNPTFHYNPALFWDADSGGEKAVIPAGPNNPVGVVWIDLSKEHYGIHGTPEPSNIGKTQSHGCIRMTNWSALAVSLSVEPGTPVTLRR